MKLDDRAVAPLACLMLERTRACLIDHITHAVPAASGPQRTSDLSLALGLLRTRPVDALVLVIDWLDEQALREIRLLRELSDAPMVVVAGEVAPSHAAAAARIGCHRLLAAPQTWPRVANLLSQVIASRGALARSSHDGLLDRASGSLRVGPVVVPLTPSEFAIVQTLARQPGAYVDRAVLVAQCRPGVDPHASQRRIDRHVHRLRRKLAHLAACHVRIESQYGCGYRLTVAADPKEAIA